MIDFVKGLFEWLKCESINVQVGSLSVLMLKAFLPHFLIIIFCFPLPTAGAFYSLPSRPVWPPALQGRSASHSKLFECVVLLCCFTSHWRKAKSRYTGHSCGQEMNNSLWTIVIGLLNWALCLITFPLFRSPEKWDHQGSLCHMYEL